MRPGRFGHHRFLVALLVCTTAVGSPAIADIVVTTNADELDDPAGELVSLREAIRDAVAGETITFDSSLSGAQVLLGGTQLEIDKALSIDASSLSNGVSIYSATSRALLISGPNEVVLRGLSIRGETADSDWTIGHYIPEPGGGIRCDNFDGRLTLIDCQFSDCRTGVGYAEECEACITSAGGLGGGVYCSGGALVVIGCRFTTNRTGSGASGGQGGAIYKSAGTLEIRGSTFSGNRTGGAQGRLYIGGGSGGSGGAVFISGVEATISDCMFSDNETGNGEGAVRGAAAMVVMEVRSPPPVDPSGSKVRYSPGTRPVQVARPALRFSRMKCLTLEITDSARSTVRTEWRCSRWTARF